MSGRSSEQLIPARYMKLIAREQSIQKHFPQLYSFLERKRDDFRGFNLTESSQGGYLIILKRFSDDGHPEVLFGGDVTPLEALFAVEAALASDKWRAEKQWVAPEKA